MVFKSPTGYCRLKTRKGKMLYFFEKGSDVFETNNVFEGDVLMSINYKFVQNRVFNFIIAYLCAKVAVKMHVIENPPFDVRQ